jgi:hypothetical protein
MTQLCGTFRRQYSVMRAGCQACRFRSSRWAARARDGPKLSRPSACPPMTTTRAVHEEALPGAPLLRRRWMAKAMAGVPASATGVGGGRTVFQPLPHAGVVHVDDGADGGVALVNGGVAECLRGSCDHASAGDVITGEAPGDDLGELSGQEPGHAAGAGAGDEEGVAAVAAEAEIAEADAVGADADQSGPPQAVAPAAQLQGRRTARWWRELHVTAETEGSPSPSRFG